MKYIIKLVNDGGIAEYFMSWISIPMFGDSPQISRNRADAKRYDSKVEADRDAYKVGYDAVVIKIYS